jgi:hypothetical protein
VHPRGQLAEPERPPRLVVGISPRHNLSAARPMDPGLHVKQAVNHLNKVLAYAPYVREGGHAVVALTPEDWQVVADALFRMDVPRSVLPAAIEDFKLVDNGRSIELATPDGFVTVEMG